MTAAPNGTGGDFSAELATKAVGAAVCPRRSLRLRTRLDAVAEPEHVVGAALRALKL